MQFNIHTHQSLHPKLEIYNHRLGIDSDEISHSGYFSAGIHPWDIENIDIGLALKVLNIKLNDDRYIALGECGIDKVCGTDLAYQKKIFRDQLEIAHQSNIKVLIIHCVKAYQEILEEKLNCPYEFIWILHAFNGSKQLIKQMSNHGFYFSLGTFLINSKTKIAQCAKEIPLDKMFLETDDSDICIDAVYNKTANILGLSIEKLEKQVERNIKNILPSLSL